MGLRRLVGTGVGGWGCWLGGLCRILARSFGIVGQSLALAEFVIG